MGFGMGGLQLEGLAVAANGVSGAPLLLSGDAEIVVRICLVRIDPQSLLIGSHGFGELAGVADPGDHLGGCLNVPRIQRDRFLVRLYGVRGAARLLRDDAEVEPVHRRGRLSLHRRMKIVQRFRKALLAVGDQAEEVQGFRMIGQELECLSVGRFGFGEALRLLMNPSLLEPTLNRCRCALMWVSTLCCLTPSLGSIHDAPTAAGPEGN